MKLILLILAIAVFTGCDIIDPVGVDIKGTAPAKQQSATAPPEADIIFGENVEKYFIGKVVKTTDGDTVTVLVDGEQIKVRLASIDTPERKQPFGEKAKDQLAGMIQGQDVRVAQTDVDRYGRRVGFIVFQGANVNAWMIETGMAWHYKQYSKDAALAQLEVTARQSERGLWAGMGPDDQVPPWEWRKR